MIDRVSPEGYPEDLTRCKVVISYHALRRLRRRAKRVPDDLQQKITALLYRQLAKGASFTRGSVRILIKAGELGLPWDMYAVVVLSDRSEWVVVTFFKTKRRRGQAGQRGGGECGHASPD